MENHSESVYKLITKLCENYVNKHNSRTIYPNKIDIKRLRSKCYEILLSKRTPTRTIDELENISDPFCHLLAWQFQLMTKYQLPEHAKQLRLCSEKLEQLNACEDSKLFANIVLLLLQLRRVPKDENKIMETTLSKHYSEEFNLNKSTIFPYFEEHTFNLPKDPFKLNLQFENDQFELHDNKVSRQPEQSVVLLDFLQSSHIMLDDNMPLELERNDYDHEEDHDIWELASSEPFCHHRTWESYGCHSSIKEPPFLCESGTAPVMWLHNLCSNFENWITEKYTGTEVKQRVQKIVLSQTQFIKSIKYLLVGLESQVFKYSGKNELELVEGTCIEGLSPGVITSYCRDLLVCSSCYRGLNNLCTLNPFTLKYLCNGYIFSEMCESIKRYLLYYRAAVFSLSDTLNLLHFSESTKQLQQHITVLASVCKVGPFAKSEQIPHGVALLNYLYQQVMIHTDKVVYMVLYAILYPCCQAYFSRFLHQWILGGLVEDPHEEFFIKENPKYIVSRGRTYWTRSYTLQEDLVPDFMTDLRSEILLCGKAINLLKLCVPNSPLCLYLMEKRPNIVSCCVMPEQLVSLELNNHYYYLEATAVSGPRISLSQIIISSHEQDNVLLSLIAKKRTATLTRIELERKKSVEAHFEKKRSEMKILQEQYAEAMQLKRAKIAEEVQEEIKTIEKDMRMQMLHDKIIKEETNNLIEYYNGLCKESENRKLLFEDRLKNLSKYHLGAKEQTKSVRFVPQSLDKRRNSVNETTSQSYGDHTLTKTISEKSISLTTSISSDTFISSSSDDVTQRRSEEYFSADSNLNLNIIDEQNLNVLDIVNANTNLLSDTIDKPVNVGTVANENFKVAQINKSKILASEIGTLSKTGKKVKSPPRHANVKQTQAQKNKMKILSSEYESRLTDAHNASLPDNNKTSPTLDEQNNLVQTKLHKKVLTDAKKNKLKVLSVEYGHKVRKNKKNVGYVKTDLEKNKLKILLSNISQDLNVPNSEETNTNLDSKEEVGVIETNTNKILDRPFEAFQTQINDNRNNICDNHDTISDTNSNNITNKWVNKKQDSLSLDLTKVTAIKENVINNKLEKVDKSTIKCPKFELDKISPMSIDSTPLSNVTTPSNKLSISVFEKPDFESSPSYSSTTITASTAAVINEKGFNFEIEKSNGLINLANRQSEYNLDFVQSTIFQKKISLRDAGLVTPNYLQFCLQQSISIPLVTQVNLITNELLKYFIKNLEYLKHLNSLRNYFFLLDGEFGRNITEGLFEKVYDANFPIDVINCHTLQFLMHKAIDYSTKFQDNSSCLSFKINSLPKVFALGDPDVFDCISLTYKAAWPLNILLPSDTIAKYDEVFKFVLKLHRIAWVLQNLFQDLKFFLKEDSSAKILSSPHYRRLHQCRHIMTHFVQTLQSYIVGEVLQSSWQIFEKNLESVTNFDQLYTLHTIYIKNILFKCLLNQKSTPLRKTLHKVFVVILKFYDYLRSCCWVVEDGVYIHPNFKKLEDIFSNFEDLTKYLFKIGHKVVKSGYQPHLMQLLDMLDINKYYSKSVDDSVSLSSC